MFKLYKMNTCTGTLIWKKNLGEINVKKRFVVLIRHKALVC